MPDPKPRAESTALPPSAWRAIAHPVRLALIEKLQQRRTARASDLAALIDEPANSVSFHLRQLAKHGLVEQDPQPPSTDARERWWRLTEDASFRVSGEDVNADSRRDYERMARVLRQRAHQRVDDFFDAAVRLDSPDSEVESGNTDLLLRLSATEINTLRSGISDLLQQYQKISRDHRDDEDLLDYRIFLLSQPESQD